MKLMMGIGPGGEVDQALEPFKDQVCKFSITVFFWVYLSTPMLITYLAEPIREV